MCDHLNTRLTYFQTAVVATAGYIVVDGAVASVIELPPTTSRMHLHVECADCPARTTVEVTEGSGPGNLMDSQPTWVRRAVDILND